MWVRMRDAAGGLNGSADDDQSRQFNSLSPPAASGGPRPAPSSLLSRLQSPDPCPFVCMPQNIPINAQLMCPRLKSAPPDIREPRACPAGRDRGPRTRRVAWPGRSKWRSDLRGILANRWTCVVPTAPHRTSPPSAWSLSTSAAPTIARQRTESLTGACVSAA